MRAQQWDKSPQGMTFVVLNGRLRVGEVRYRRQRRSENGREMVSGDALGVSFASE